MTPDMMQDIQQEALRIAKRKEMKITESSTNVFGAMVKILTESAMTIPSLQEAYLDESGRVDFETIIGETKAIYTFMEALNTIGVINVNEDFLNTTLAGMKASIDDFTSNNIIKDPLDNSNKITKDEDFIQTGDKVEPKEITHFDGSNQENERKNDFVDVNPKN